MDKFLFPAVLIASAFSSGLISATVESGVPSARILGEGGHVCVWGSNQCNYTCDHRNGYYVTSTPFGKMECIQFAGEGDCPVKNCTGRSYSDSQCTNDVGPYSESKAYCEH